MRKQQKQMSLKKRRKIISMALQIHMELRKIQKQKIMMKK